MSEEIEISGEVYEQSVIEVDDTISYIRFYHYLAHLNYLNPLQETKQGALVAPPKMMKSIGYGFARNNQVFCVHLTGIMFEYFERFFPVQCILTDKDADEDGIILMMKPLKYAEYKFPPLILFLPILSPLIFNRLKNNCDKVCFTKLEQSAINPDYYEVEKVLEGCVKISTKAELTIKDEHEEIKRMF